MDTDAQPQRPPLDRDRLQRVEQELADVEHALGRLDDGSYGTCEACGSAIDDTRLTEQPAARACAAHA